MPESSDCGRSERHEMDVRMSSRLCRCVISHSIIGPNPFHLAISLKNFLKRIEAGSLRTVALADLRLTSTS